MAIKKFFLILFLSTILLLFFFNRGFLYHDEGFILHAVQRFAHGEVPYRDFDFIYTPGILFILLPFFKIFGESIIMGRIVVLIVQVLTTGFIYTLTKRINKNNLMAVLSIVVFLIFGPGHINFPWPIVFALLTGVSSIFFILEGNFFLSGIFALFVFLFKQNFGSGVILTIVIYFLLFEKNKQRHWKEFITGAGLIIGLFLFYLFASHSLNNFLEQFFYVANEVIFKKALATDFPGLNKINIWEIGKFFFYIFPGLISLLAMIVSFKKCPHGFLLSTFTFFFYIFGIRPTTDYTHIVYLASLVGIPLSVITEIFKNKLIKLLVVILLIIFAVLGIYNIFYRNYYRWEAPIFNHKYFINNPRMEIMVDQKYERIIPILNQEVERYTKKNDYIFSFYRAPIFYFIFNRRNPTRFIHLSPDSNDKKIQTEIINNLRSKDVKLIITHDFPPGGNKILVEYIKNNYKVAKNILEFKIWFKSDAATINIQK